MLICFHRSAPEIHADPIRRFLPKSIYKRLLKAESLSLRANVGNRYPWKSSGAKLQQTSRKPVIPLENCWTLQDSSKLFYNYQLMQKIIRLQTFYRIIVFGTLTILALMAAFDLFAILSGYDSTRVVDAPLFILGPFAFVCSCFAIGTIVLSFGMMCHCAFISEMPIWSKAAWLVHLFLTCTLGALIYYFCVYRKRTTNKVLAGT